MRKRSGSLPLYAAFFFFGLACGDSSEDSVPSEDIVDSGDPIAAVHRRGTLAFPATLTGQVELLETELKDGRAREVQRIRVGPGGLIPYGVSETYDARVLIAEPVEHYVGVVDLETNTAFTVPWEGDEYGPTEIKLIP
jgi:hypothetical protein